ncbi:MAG: L-seryl-tRNA(Sec) selenium transferase [Fusobacteriaceae bacterium]|nr:L-seryl-tRNA(Sec) selenium transferase [Fusobacteriaceae bacterium]
MKQELLRKLPKVDKLLNDEELFDLGRELDYYTFAETIKKSVEIFREGILKNEIIDFSEKDVINKIIEIGSINKLNSLRKVINGTGTIIHTNLGRSKFSERVIKNMLEVGFNYTNLEYDLENGRRGSRYAHLEELICKVTGAEAAIVVNNNAAAVILALNELAKGKETIVSRGELVEIGGSFRIPDIMKLSGSKLVEVGTTNRTYAGDYIDAINEETGLLLKVHTSNYKITGFVSNISPQELAKIGSEKGIITMEDIGSGVLIDFSKYGVTKEPTVQESIVAGVDIVTFSGDKLLGGPQGGIIVGKKDIIERLKKNQYMRAFRMDKISIAALEVTFKYYLDEREAIKNIPTLKMILENPQIVKERAEKLYSYLEKTGVKVTVIPTEAKIGGGSMPEETVPSYGVAFEGNANYLEEKFRKNILPIIGRIYEDRFVIDMKTLSNEEIEVVADHIKRLYI